MRHLIKAFPIFFLKLVFFSQGYFGQEQIVKCPDLAKDNSIKQFVITTNLLAAIRLYRQFKDFPVAINLSLHTRPSAHVGHRFCLQVNSNTFTESSGGGLFGTYHQDITEFQTAGLRYGLKLFTKKRIDHLQKGFYCGPFIDAMYVQRLHISKIGPPGSVTASPTQMHVQYKKTEGKGIYIAPGISCGYAFTNGLWVIDPVLGFGVGWMSEAAEMPADPDAFFDVSRICNGIMRLSASHVQLHVGRLIR
jgi:hypothetical protein